MIREHEALKRLTTHSHVSTALIGLGSNVGDRRHWLEQAIQRLSVTAGISSVRASSWRETRAVGGPSDQPDFLNGAALVETTLAPEPLLARLREIEAELGRVRDRRWGARTIDLDLLLYDQVIQRNPHLELPHPRMAFRRFVLEPAAEVAGQMVHPVIGWTIAELLEHLNTARPYVAISGSLFRVTQQLADAIAAKTGWEVIESNFENPLPLGEGWVRVQEFQPPDSPSLSLGQTIEFLREQAALVDQGNWPPERRAISSFWMEDLLAIGDVLWPGDLDEVWRSLIPTVVAPKLLVVYEASTDQFRREGDSDQQNARSVAIALWHRLNEARRARAARPGVGPVLWLDASDPAAAESELIAAIKAVN
jgi:2-amino-4-hydroxy-6-hydroxymethyldihydropteridine diphosphokinase